MKTWISAGLVAALGLLLALPISASARPGWEEQPRSLHLSFQAPAGNGYTMALETTGHRQVNLRLSKGGVSAGYRTTGQVSRNGIEADFAELGEISVEFSGRPTRFAARRGALWRFLPRPECRGRRPQQESGTFHGTIRFEGENGFARIDTDRAKGTMRRTYRRLCKGGAFRRPSSTRPGGASASAAGKPKIQGLHMNVLVVGGDQAGRAVFFETVEFAGSSGYPWLDEFIKAFGPIAVAKTYEHRDGVRIIREALALGGEDSLIVSSPKRERIAATVAFAKPFGGTARFERPPGSPPTWTGTLHVRLPGAGAVPLTGDELRPVFCRVGLDDDGDERNPCRKEVEAAEEGFPGARHARPLLSQGSGSHSQALADVRLSWSR